MFKLVMFHILSKLRFIFYPFATFPDPLEYLERKSALDLRANELADRMAYLDGRSIALQRRERLMEEKEKDLYRKQTLLSRAQNALWRDLELDKEVELTDIYGNKIYAKKKE